MKRIILKPGEEYRIAQGHPWVYDNEIDTVLDGRTRPPEGAAALLPGEIADVESSRKEYLGRAFVNPASKIRARIYSSSKEGFDRGFIKRRIREALRRRPWLSQGPWLPQGSWLSREALPVRNGAEPARILFGEADFLPGLVIDRYAGWPLEEAEAAVTARPLTAAALDAALGPPRSWLAVQFLALGIETRREEILAALEELFSRDPAPDTVPGITGRAGSGATGDPVEFSQDAEHLDRPLGIIEKSSTQARELEGLPPGKGLLAGEIPAGGILIFENGLPFAVDLAEGQKTGHYLDQKDNRLLAASFAAGKVLDAFCYSGGFAVHAARLGAPGVTVTAVDSSGPALDLARRNAALNGIGERMETVEADVFDFLRGAERRKERYDMIILDPPAFAKSRAGLPAALRGYQEINSAALRLLNPGGVLASCSCSQALDQIEFMRMIARSAARAGRSLVQEEFRFQGRDHPVRVGYGESLYLKCGIYRVRQEGRRAAGGERFRTTSGGGVSCLQ